MAVLGRVSWAGRGLCAFGVALAMPTFVLAHSFPPQEPRGIEPVRELALTPPTGIHRMLNGTGFFVDDNGHMLTAAHAVEACKRVLVGKERHRIVARVVAKSARYDLALLKVPKTLGLAGVFPRTATPAVNDMMFAGAYRTLSGLPLGGGGLANARVTSSFSGSEAGYLVIDSPVTFGASGSPVLDKNGLVQGVVSRRTMINRVLAVGAAESKAFLAANGVRFTADDRPQLAGSAPRASRAASISANVTCLQN